MNLVTKGADGALGLATKEQLTSIVKGLQEHALDPTPLMEDIKLSKGVNLLDGKRDGTSRLFREAIKDFQGQETLDRLDQTTDTRAHGYRSNFFLSTQLKDPANQQMASALLSGIVQTYNGSDSTPDTIDTMKNINIWIRDMDSTTFQRLYMSSPDDVQTFLIAESLVDRRQLPTQDQHKVASTDLTEYMSDQRIRAFKNNLL